MASTTMRAILIKGGISQTAKGLYMGETLRPVAKAGEVLVKIKAFGLNRMDIMQRKGQYPLPPGVSTILGVEFSGTIEDANGSDWKEGDAVFGLAYGGAYAEYIAVAQGMVVAKPDGLSWVKAASIPENWLTAWQALFWIGEMKKGQSVLIHAGCSGVGLAAIQLAKAFGAGIIISTAGTDEKVKFVAQHGAIGINYKTQDFSAEVLKLTSDLGVNLVVDFIGADYWTKNITSMAKEGHMVLLGLMGGSKTEGPLDLLPILFKRLRIEGTTLRSRSLEYQSNLLKEFSEKAIDKVFHRAANGSDDGLMLVIHKVFDWAHVIEAQEEMEASKNIGKIICEIK